MSIDDVTEYIAKLEYVDASVREKLSGIVGTVFDCLLKNSVPKEVPEEVFVSTSDSGGVLNVTVWLFTPRLVVQIRNPLDKDRIQYEMAPFKDAVDWIRLNARKFDLNNSSDDSELELEFTTADGLSQELSATGKGCDHLMRVYRDMFLANFKTLSALEAEARVRQPQNDPADVQ